MFNFMARKRINPTVLVENDLERTSSDAERCSR
jgi:hypothetical protein